MKTKNNTEPLSEVIDDAQSTQGFAINQWAEEDRPREKLMANGPAALSDSELLAILIGSGSTKESAVSLMQRILRDCDNNLNTLGKMSLCELMRYRGIGEAKAVTILAACELGKRRQTTKPALRPDMGSAQAVYDYMHPKMQDLDVEEAWTLLMNIVHKIAYFKHCRLLFVSPTKIQIIFHSAKLFLIYFAFVIVFLLRHSYNNVHR